MSETKAIVYIAVPDAQHRVLNSVEHKKLVDAYNTEPPVSTVDPDVVVFFWSPSRVLSFVAFYTDNCITVARNVPLTYVEGIIK